ncbi:MAG TPA: tetratricopeptide repeat protein [Armatimonadota bacterium]|nr:tetratricopeptide repeat protein [Armatimonadota bacterium]
MKSYYALLDLQPKATPGQIQAVFRRLVARYRPTLTVEQIFADPHFLDYLNAYLTISGELREEYDKALAHADRHHPYLPHPYDWLTAEAQHLLIARVAYWRREMVEAIHQLRLVLEQEPDSADAWALLGEIYLTVGRVADGIHAFQRAVHAAPHKTQFAERLQHAQEVADGKIDLQVEASPEEELLKEERRQRRGFTILLILLGIASLVYSFFLPLKTMLGFLDIAWPTVTLQAAGIMLLLGGLGYGRVIRPFEHVMIWSTIDTGDRGRIRHLPYALLLLVLTAASLWLAVLGFVVMALMDDEWPGSAAVMVSVCALVNIGFGTLLYLGNLPWGNAMVFGGNLLLIAAMLGWYVGSLGAPRFES